MKRRSVITAVVLGISILTSEAMYASPVAAPSPMHAMFNGQKLVKFNLRNATDAPLKVKAGDVEMTLAPGQNVPLKLPVGSKIVVEEATAHYAQGSVLAVVTDDIIDVTARLN